MVKLYSVFAVFHNGMVSETQYRTFRILTETPTNIPSIVLKRFKKPQHWLNSRLLNVSILDTTPFAISMLNDESLIQDNLDVDTLRGIGSADEQFKPVEESGFNTITVPLPKGS